MLSKRVLAVAPDKAFAKRMASGLMAAGATVETIPSLDELPRGDIKADLVCLHAVDRPVDRTAEIAGRLAPGASLIVIIPASSLEDTVALMGAGRVAAVLVADELEQSRLAAIATRLLHGDIFGLEKSVPWGVKVYSVLVGDYHEKSVAIATVSDFAGAMGVRRKYREAIEQCLDELIMNALYDAPVDAGGKQMFADVPTKTRISLRMEQKATVEYACDGATFSMSVRDSFGTLRSDTILTYLDKCLHADQQIDRKTGGAGLGLYIISNSATQFLVSVHPQVATECTCTFDLNAAKVQLKSFGFFQERIDSSGRLVAGRSRLMAQAPQAFAAAAVNRTVLVALGAAIASVLALIFVVAYPRIKKPTPGGLMVSTDPSGATVEVDGLAKGSSGERPLLVSDLVAGEKYKVVARREGFEPAVELVTGSEKPAPFLMTLRALPATLTVTTQPPGASVRVDGRELGASPVTVSDLKPGSQHSVRVEKNGWNDLEQKVTAPQPGTRAELQLNLVHTAELSTVHIDSDPPGAELLQNGELIAGQRTPISDYMIQVGKTYSFTLRAPGYAPSTVSVTGREKSGPLEPVSVKLRRGGTLTVETPVPEARVTVQGVDACQNRPGPSVDCPLENGKYKVRVVSIRPFIAETFTVEMKGADLQHKLDVGFVETNSPDLSIKLAGAPIDTHRAAFTDGEHHVTLVNAKSGLTIIKPVRVMAGRTVTVGD